MDNEKYYTFAPHLRAILNDAQMAESVDALVSNTSGFTSIPVRPRVWVQELRNSFRSFFYVRFEAKENMLDKKMVSIPFDTISASVKIVF